MWTLLTKVHCVISDAKVYRMMKEVQEEFDIVLEDHEWVDAETAEVIRQKVSLMSTFHFW
jgi:hypothetical protein